MENTKPFFMPSRSIIAGVDILLTIVITGCGDGSKLPITNNQPDTVLDDAVRIFGDDNGFF